MAGLFPMGSAFERPFGIDQDVGDVLDFRLCAPWRTSYMRDDEVWPPSMQARSEAVCPRTSRNFATRPACRALIGTSLRLRARLIALAGLRSSPWAT